MAGLTRFPRRVPWSYRAGTGPLYCLPAGYKLAALFALSAAPALGPAFLGGAAALVALGALCAGLRSRDLLAGSRPLVVTFGTVCVFSSINFTGFPAAFYYAVSAGGAAAIVNTGALMANLYLGAGILLAFSAGSLLFAVTTMTEIIRFLDKAERFLRSPVDRILGKTHRTQHRTRGVLALALALMLGFIPRFFERWEEAEIAAAARGCGHRGLRGRLRRITVLLPLVSGRMIESAQETALALESRAYSL